MSCVTGSSHWMPKGKEAFIADLGGIISYLAMCLWSLCLPVGCEERLKLLCFSQPHQPALDSDGVQAWLKGLQTGVYWPPSQEISRPSLPGWHCGFHLETLNHRGAFILPRAQKSFLLLQALVWPQDSWFPVVWGEWGFACSHCQAESWGSSMAGEPFLGWSVAVWIRP